MKNNRLCGFVVDVRKQNIGCSFSGYCGYCGFSENRNNRTRKSQRNMCKVSQYDVWLLNFVSFAYLWLVVASGDMNHIVITY